MNQNFQGGYDPSQGQQQQGYYNEDQQQQQQQGDQFRATAPVAQGSRPFVDPAASGEVDPNQYPEPKESTKKIRGRSDIIEFFCNNVSQELVIAKTFYFFFFSAFGSLFPLMAVYFKQMGMNPGQTGFLIGCRPLVEFLASPFWGSIAVRFQKGKIMLLCAVFAWIFFTLSVGFVQPPATSCVIFNGTHHILRDPDTASMKKRSVSQEDYFSSMEDTNVPYGKNTDKDKDRPVMPHLFHKRSLQWMEDSIYVQEEEPVAMPLEEQPKSRRVKRDTPLPPNHVIGKSPNVVHYTVNFAEFEEAEDWLSPPFSSIVYRESDVQKCFFLLLLLVILGEFFSCPAITLADTAVLNYLGDDADHYGSQRMFGSLGWGLAMFFIGIALDHSTAFPGHPCGPHENERNYTICFAVFSVLMGCAFITATQFKFEHSDPVSNVLTTEEPASKEPEDTGPKPWNEPKIPMLQTKSKKEQLEETLDALKGKTRIYANTMKEMPEWKVVLKDFHNLRCGMFLFIAWWMGFGIGLIFAFLFWHLQDYGGTPTVFGIASIINHISEIFAYFFSFRLIAQVGHVKVLCIGLLGNVLRFLYISVIKNPWWVLPFEFIQGITHASVWAACCSYIAHNTQVELRGSAQGVLQGIHHGLGRGCGAIVGGLFVNYFGTAVVFRAYGAISLLILGAFVFVNFYKKDGTFQHDVPPELDPRQMAEEGTALAPHGVPANPMPRAHSSQKLDQMPDQSSGYGTYSNNGMLGIPGGDNGGGGQQSGANNPFQGGQPGSGGGGGGSGGGGYSQYKTGVTEAEIVSEKNVTIPPSLQTAEEPQTYPKFLPTNPFRDDAAFEEQSRYYEKGSPEKSPELNVEYDAIKNRFKAYNSLLHDLNYEKERMRENDQIRDYVKDSAICNKPLTY